MLEWYAIQNASPGYAEVVRRANQRRNYSLRNTIQVAERQIRSAVRALNDLRASWNRRRAEVATITSLSTLDDAVLNDIGVSRADIHHVARALANGNARQARSGVVGGRPEDVHLVVDNSGSTSQSPEQANAGCAELRSRKAA